MYVLDVFQVSSLKSFAPNFSESSWFGILLTFSTFSWCNVWWFNLLSDFLCKEIVFHMLVYREKCFQILKVSFHGQVLRLLQLLLQTVNCCCKHPANYFVNDFTTFNPSFSYIIKDSLICTINFRNRPLHSSLFAIAASMIVQFISNDTFDIYSSEICKK